MKDSAYEHKEDIKIGAEQETYVLVVMALALWNVVSIKASASPSGLLYLILDSCCLP